MNTTRPQSQEDWTLLFGKMATTELVSRAQVKQAQTAKANVIHDEAVALISSISSIDDLVLDAELKGRLMHDLCEGIYISASTRVVLGRARMSLSGFVDVDGRNQRVPEWVHKRGVVGLVERACSKPEVICSHPLMMVSGARYLDMSKGASQSIHLFLVPFDPAVHVVAVHTGFSKTADKKSRATAVCLLPSALGGGDLVPWSITITPGRTKMRVMEDRANRHPGWVVLERSNVEDYIRRKQDTARAAGFFNLGELSFNPF